MLVIVTLLLIATVILLAWVAQRLNGLRQEIQLLGHRIDYLRQRIDAVTGAPGKPTPGVAARQTPPPARSTIITPQPPGEAEATRPSAAAPPPPPAAGPRRPVAPPPLSPTEEAPRTTAGQRRAAAAREALGKAWNWILFGQEARPTGVTLEYAVASTWLPRIGILGIVLGIAVFLIWTAEQQIIGPVGRIAIAIASGIALLVGGIRLVGRKYHLIGQVLLGGGLLVLYFCGYAMGPRYELVPLPAAFALMVFVTAVAVMLALRIDAMLVAILGIAGGYMTPLLIRTPEPNLAAFYAYLLILGLATLAITARRPWRLLNVLGFIGTYALFVASLDRYARADFPLAITALVCLFVVQSAIVYLHNVLRREPSGILEILHLTANAVAVAAIGYGLIHDAVGRPYPALLSLGLAVFYTVHVLVLIRRGIADRPLLVAMIALAGAFATWTLPLVLEKDSLTIALSLLAFMFLWLSHKMDSRFLRNLAHALYAAVFLRLALWDFDRHYHVTPSADLPFRDYLRHLVNRLFTFGTAVASLVAAFIVQRRSPAPDDACKVPAEADTRLLVEPAMSKGLFYWAALVAVVAFLNAELWALFVYAPAWRLSAIMVVWCGLALYFLSQHRTESGRGVMFWAMVGVFAFATAKLLAVDLPAWKCSRLLIYHVPYRAVDAAARALDFAVLLAGALVIWQMLSHREPTRRAAPVFGYGALAVFFLFATLELHTLLYWKWRPFAEGGLSILWAAFAIAFIAGGIWKNVTPLRYAGLALVSIVIAKVFIVDLREMVMIVKVVAFLAVGAILLLGSFVYIHSSRMFSRESDGA
jgi:hypothetical protein